MKTEFKYKSLTAEQKLLALKLRFYDDMEWRPKAGDYYTTSRNDLELYKVVEIKMDYWVYTNYCDPAKTTEQPSEWLVSHFTKSEFGPRRVWVPNFILDPTVTDRWADLDSMASEPKEKEPLTAIFLKEIGFTVVSDGYFKKGNIMLHKSPDIPNFYLVEEPYEGHVRTVEDVRKLLDRVASEVEEKRKGGELWIVFKEWYKQNYDPYYEKIIIQIDRMIAIEQRAESLLPLFESTPVGDSQEENVKQCLYAAMELIGGYNKQFSNQPSVLRPLIEKYQELLSRLQS